MPGCEHLHIRTPAGIETLLCWCNWRLLGGFSIHFLGYRVCFAIERRVTAIASAGSFKLPSPAPVAASVHAGSSSNVGGGVTQRSRLSQQLHPRHSPARPRRVTTSVGPDADEDAEGEEDVEETGEEGGDVEDKELYCFCQKLSYGEVRLGSFFDFQNKYLSISVGASERPGVSEWCCTWCPCHCAHSNTQMWRRGVQSRFHIRTCNLRCLSGFATAGRFTQKFFHSWGFRLLTHVIWPHTDDSM